jgi:cobalt/nickel transport protein
MKTGNALLLAAAILLAAAPFARHGWSAREFSGTDDQAEAAIRQVRPDYEPWFRSLFEPGEGAEQRLFALQALGGAGALGYCLFRLRARNRAKDANASETRGH